MPDELRIEQGAVDLEQMVEVEGTEWITAPQLAAKMQYSREWIRCLLQSGRIRGVKPFGTHWRIPKSEYERLVRVGVPPPPRKPRQTAVADIEATDDQMAKIVPTQDETTPQKPPQKFLDWLLFGSNEETEG